MPVEVLACSRNQIRARYEGRFGVEVYRPTGVVEIDLAAQYAA